MNTLVDRLYSFLRSLRLAAVLLIILALLSVAGGIIPQGKPADFYFSQMPSVARLILWLGFDHLFTSRLFLIAVALFTTNLTVCTVHRLGNEFAKPRAMRRHGPDLLHLGLIIIIFGSILTSRTRTEYFFTVGEGQHIHLPDRQVLYITRLEQETYEGGRVRTWITEGSIGPAPVETPHDGDTGGDTLGEEGYAAEAGALGIRMPQVPLQTESTEKSTLSTSGTESIAAVPQQVQPQGTPVTIKVNAP
ncbi:MAG: cytochrome c biogenesis protein ResB, partial [Spirochaetales bacterium]|nr:cytochrome c biogenesis protein ResB [Spirochaetales bacterium]